jgi:hypothetical protein
MEHPKLSPSWRCVADLLAPVRLVLVAARDDQDHVRQHRARGARLGARHNNVQLEGPRSNQRKASNTTEARRKRVLNADELALWNITIQYQWFV